MNGLIALLGSGEYLPVMDDVDRYLLANCGAQGRRPRVVCLPTAAGREGEGSVGRWSKMGVEHFSHLGADVQAVAVIDKQTAQNEQLAALIEAADLVYFSGGDPGYLFQTMKDSRAWAAAQKAWMRGAVYAGCSAGAMILGRTIPDFRMMGLRTTEAFGILRANYVIPHFDAIPGIWKPMINSLRRRMKPGEVMIGIEEDTAIVGKLNSPWTVMGSSKAHVLSKTTGLMYGPGETFTI